MPKATWNGAMLAQAGTDRVKVVEGNIYFPPDAINKEYVRSSTSHTRCFWKGTASYYDVVVDGQVNRDAAWYYPDPSEAAKEIKGYVAFWHGIKVEKGETSERGERGERAGTGRALDDGSSHETGNGPLRTKVSGWLQSLRG